MSNRLALILFTFYLLLMGMGQLLILPPFEGFDEVGHYSLIRQTLQLGAFPNSDNAFIGQEIEAYRKNAPMPYAVFEPYDKNNGMTYPAFFAKPELVQQYEPHYREKTEKDGFVPTPTSNWQRQHPPLYYLTMAAVMKASSMLSFVDQFFVLRLVSYLLACAGMVIGFYGTLKYTDPSCHKYVRLAFLLYPIILPQVVPEFARLGNDSLCTLFTGVLWLLFLRDIKGHGGALSALLVGLLFCVGLLTKGLFIPLVAGWGSFSLCRIVQMRRERRLVIKSLALLALAYLPVLLGCFWYLDQYVTTGTMLGHPEYKIVREQGGLLAHLFIHFNAQSFLYALFNVLFSWVWAGTASLVRPHELFMFPLSLVSVWLFIRACSAPREKKEGGAYLLLFLFVPLVAGLLHHCFILAALDTTGGTPGWYLHILMPAMSYLFAIGLSEIAKDRLSRFLLVGLVSYAFVFLIVGFWSFVSLYGGCAEYDSHKLFAFPDGALCLTRFDVVMRNLGVLSWPKVGLFFIGGAFLTSFACLVALWRQIPHNGEEFISFMKDRACNALPTR